MRYSIKDTLLIIILFLILSLVFYYTKNAISSYFTSIGELKDVSIMELNCEYRESLFLERVTHFTEEYPQYSVTEHIRKKIYYDNPYLAKTKHCLLRLHSTDFIILIGIGSAEAKSIRYIYRYEDKRIEDILVEDLSGKDIEAIRGEIDSILCVIECPNCSR